MGAFGGGEDVLTDNGPAAVFTVHRCGRVSALFESFQTVEAVLWDQVAVAFWVGWATARLILYAKAAIIRLIPSIPYACMQKNARAHAYTHTSSFTRMHASYGAWLHANIQASLEAAGQTEISLGSLGVHKATPVRHISRCINAASGCRGCQAAHGGGMDVGAHEALEVGVLMDSGVKALLVNGHRLRSTVSTAKQQKLWPPMQQCWEADANDTFSVAISIRKLTVGHSLDDQHCFHQQCFCRCQHYFMQAPLSAKRCLLPRPLGANTASGQHILMPILRWGQPCETSLRTIMPTLL